MIPVHRTRIARVLQILSETVLGNYDSRLEGLDDSPDDEFLEVEVAINAMLDELQLTRQRSTAQHREIEHQAAQLRRQQAELLDLSTPIVRVAPRVLALPLIGAIESERAQRMAEAVLGRIVAERATHVILDMTAAGEIASTTAQAVLRMVQAVRLLGAQCLITGLSPAMARTLVSHNFDSSQVATLPQMEDALALVLGSTRWRGVQPAVDSMVRDRGQSRSREG